MSDILYSEPRDCTEDKQEALILLQPGVRKKKNSDFIASLLPVMWGLMSYILKVSYWSLPIQSMGLMYSIPFHP